MPINLKTQNSNWNVTMRHIFQEYVSKIDKYSKVILLTQYRLCKNQSHERIIINHAKL